MKKIYKYYVEDKDHIIYEVYYYHTDLSTKSRGTLFYLDAIEEGWAIRWLKNVISDRREFMVSCPNRLKKILVVDILNAWREEIEWKDVIDDSIHIIDSNYNPLCGSKYIINFIETKNVADSPNNIDCWGCLVEWEKLNG